MERVQRMELIFSNMNRMDPERKMGRNKTGRWMRGIHICIKLQYMCGFKRRKAVNNANIQIYSSNGSRAQKWILTRTFLMSEIIAELASEHKDDIKDEPML